MSLWEGSTDPSNNPMGGVCLQIGNMEIMIGSLLGEVVGGISHSFI